MSIILRGDGYRPEVGDAAYKPMGNDLEGSVAFQAACELVFEGAKQPFG